MEPSVNGIDWDNDKRAALKPEIARFDCPRQHDAALSAKGIGQQTLYLRKIFRLQFDFARFYASGEGLAAFCVRLGLEAWREWARR